MKKSKYISTETYNSEAPYVFEVIRAKSMTIQGESYTIEELFERFKTGALAGIERPVYFEDTQEFDSIDFQRLKYADPFEKQTMLLEVKEKADKAIKAIEEYKRLEQKQEDAEEKTSSKSKNQKADVPAAGEAADKERSDADAANSAVGRKS